MAVVVSCSDGQELVGSQVDESFWYIAHVHKPMGGHL